MLTARWPNSGRLHDNLMNWFHGLNKRRMRPIQIVGGNFAVAGCGIELLHSVVVNLQPADRSRHPAVLIAMVMDAAGLADFPAQRHALEQCILEDQVAGVASLRIENVLFQTGRLHGMLDDIILDGLQSKILFRNGGEARDPVGDDDLSSSNVEVS